MSMTYKEARNQIFGKFKEAWDGTGFPAHYQDVWKGRSDEEAYANVFMQHTSGAQTTLSGATGARTFTRMGILTIQIFSEAGNGLQKAFELAKVCSDAFEGSSTPGGAWFRNVRVNEVGRDGEFHQLNVTVEFRYDEIK